MWARTTRVAAAGILGITLLASGCTSSSAQQDAEPDSLVQQTCELAVLAGEDPRAAGEEFDSRIHAPLHDVAGELVDTDRQAAGRLLEAKADVEALVTADDPDADRLQQALRRLAERLPESRGCPDD